MDLHLGPEQNIAGYRVLWSNDLRHEFSQRTGRPVKDTTYTDTINVHTLTPFIYYRIAAVNNRFMHSEMSRVFALRRPDQCPPEPPVFKDFTVSDTTVTLLWAYSRSEDVSSQQIRRRVGGSPDWKILRVFKSTDTLFVDHAVSKGVTYEYMVEAIDSPGLHSPPVRALQARPYDTGVCPPVQRFSAAHDRKKGVTRLNWEYPARLNEGYWFVVYRSAVGGELREYKSVKRSAHGFEDRDLIGKGTYRYAVRVQTERGGLSPSSAVTTVEVR